MLAQPVFAADAVPDEAAAIKIAEPALKARLGDEAYAKYMMRKSWVATLIDGVWAAAPILKGEPGHENDVPNVPCPDGTPANMQCIEVQTGGWDVHIDPASGKVLGVDLER